MEEMRKAALAYYSNLTDKYKQKARDLFRKMDANGDGSISAKEYTKYLESQGCKLIADPRIFRELDKDENGSLDFDEFITFFYIYLSGRFVCCDSCGVFLKGLYFSCVQCFDTRSFDLCCDCFQRKNYRHHADAVFYDNYALLRSRSVPSSRTSSSRDKIKKFMTDLDEELDAMDTVYDIANVASNLCNIM